MTDGAGRKTAYTYDAADRPLTVTPPSGGTYSTSYDKNGRVYQVKVRAKDHAGNLGPWVSAPSVKVLPPQ